MIILPLISGMLLMAVGVILFFISYASMLNNCAPDTHLQELIEDNTDQLIIISVITEVIGFMLVVVGAR